MMNGVLFNLSSQEQQLTMYCQNILMGAINNIGNYGYYNNFNSFTQQ
jgi:hypothetical protein